MGVPKKDVVQYVKDNPPHSFTYLEVADIFGITEHAAYGRIKRAGLEGRIKPRFSGAGSSSTRRKTLTRNATIKKCREFARVYNDYRNYPDFIDLARHFNVSINAIKLRASRYNEYRKIHPKVGLDELIWRSTSGNRVPIPEGVMEQLDEFRFAGHIKKGVVVTSSQFGARLHRPFWNALKGYCEYYGYELVVLPITYGPIKTVFQKETQKRRLTTIFPDDLKGHVLLEDLDLGGINLSCLRMRPTLEKYLTNKICAMGGETSQVFAGSRLELEHRPRLGHKYPKAIMTTGAVTHPDYTTNNLGQQDRTGEVAAFLHTFSAVVIEKSGKQFHFRQLLSDKKGQFYDIDPKYGGARFFTSTGNEHRPDDVDTMVMGDWHTTKTDKTVRRVTFNGMVKDLNPNHIVLHDFVDCESVNFFDERIVTRRVFKQQKGWHTLEWELGECRKELRWMRSKTDAFIHVVASNHNGYISDYIEKCKWVRDDANFDMAARLYVRLQDEIRERDPKIAVAEQGDTVQLWINDAEIENCRSHGRKHSLRLPDKHPQSVECGMHGDIGPGGRNSRSMQAFEAMNRRIIIGHTHSAAILGPVWRVGVSQPLTVSYITTPATAWTHSHCVVFKNSQRQLLNIINGEYYAR